MSYRGRMETYNYYSDHRVLESMVTPAYKVVESSRFSTTVELHECVLEDLQMEGTLPEDHDGKVSFPTRYQVCDGCGGTGRVTNPSIDCGGLSAEDFAQDPEFAEDYFSGAYDQPCGRCRGEKVTVDPTAILQHHPGVGKGIRSWEQDQAEFAAERAAELRMGC